MSIFVQFEDSNEQRIVAEFGCPQNEGGEVAGDDPRYVAFLASTAAPHVSIEQLVASERYNREASGINVDGLVIATTRDSQALIASTGLSAVLDSDYRCNFKTMNGFVEIGAAQIIAIAKAVRAHVQACFDRELALLRAIEAGEYSDDMLTEGWPGMLGEPDTTPM